MILFITLVFGLIAAVVAIFLPLQAIQIATAIIVLIALAISLLRRKRYGSVVAGKDDTGVKVRIDKPVLSGIPGQDEEETIRQRTISEPEATELKARLSEAVHGGELLSRSLSIVDKLAEIIASKAESATLQVTESIFTIAEGSLSYNRQVRRLLEDMFTVDQGLEQDIRKLITIAANIESIVREYRDLGSSYLRLLEKIEKEVHGIYNFTTGINELAETTNLLAINASIEAARMGKQGAGFSVIAKGVQELSLESKKIADGINAAARSATEIVEGTFETLSEKTLASVEVLERANGELKNISAVLETQIRIIGLSLTESKDFSQTVSDELNDVTVNLQFQDLISQVLEHILAILRDVNGKLAAIPGNADYDITIDTVRIEEELQAIVKSKLTAKEEWDAAGMSDPMHGAQAEIFVNGETGEEPENLPDAEEENDSETEDESGVDGQSVADDELEGEIDLF
jgi:methyl-accepting chemotaxis protein